MKINQIAVTLYTVRDFCQNEKDLFNDDKEFILPKIEQLEVKFIK